MKRQTEMVEGPQAWKRFEGVMKGVLAVPHSVIQKRIKEQRREAANNPNRRGPKRKVKPTAPRPGV
jgi:hypothetical protein